MTTRSTRLVGLYALVAAGLAVLLSPLLALAYFSTAEGSQELGEGTVSAWAEPALDILGGLATWSSPERAYATYVQLFALLFPAVFLCARAARARRPAGAGRLERWGWRVALVGYGLLSVGLLAAGAVLMDSSAAVKGTAAYGALDAVFITMMLPGMALSVIGSTLLGVGLLRNGYRPRTTAALLAAAFPAFVVITTLLGHNGVALLPLFVAWAVAGAQFRHEGAPGAAQAVRMPAADVS